MTRVKATVNSLTDARYFASKGVEWISFKIGDEGMPLIEAAEISEWIAGPDKIVELTNPNTTLLNEVIDKMSPNLVQLNEKDAGLAQSLNCPAMIKVQIYQAETAKQIGDRLNPLSKYGKLFILDLNKVNPILEELADLCTTHECLIESDLMEQEMLELIDHVKPYGICLSGSAEIDTGMKDFEKTDKIMESLQSEA
ncbi:MAG: hypothetical protein IH946_12625 [Bacteroidetes bacterium]|nr:hypothetical protein [Bacteroidota bacterium]